MANTLHMFDRFLASEPGEHAAITLLADLHHTEAESDGPTVQRIPYFRWEHRVDEAQKQAVLDALDRAVTQVPESLALQTAKAGLSMRLCPANKIDIQSLQNRLETSLANCNVTAILFELGNILRALPKWPVLEQVADVALSRMPDHHWQANIMADWLILARYRQFIKRRASGKARPEDMTTLEQTVTRCSQILGENVRNVAFYRSLIATLKGDLDGALAGILEAQAMQGKVIVLFERLELFSNPYALPTAPESPLQTFTGNLSDHMHHEAGNDGVLLISLDKVYFEQYGEIFLKSFGYWNPDGLVHLHCVNFSLDDNVRRQLEQEASVRINFTVDTPPGYVQAKHLFNGYCAGARYMFLNRYLSHYQKIAVTDVDGVILRSLSDIWHDRDEAILITSQLVDNQGKSSRLLWETISAGSFAISDTPGNRRFAGRLANSLANQLAFCRERQVKLFYTDQISLLLAYMASTDDCSFQSLGHLFKQKPGWQLNAATDAKIKFQKAMDFTKPTDG